MDGILIPEQHTILAKIVSFLRTFENAGLRSTPLSALPMLLGMVMLMSSHLYYGAIMYLDSAMCFIFQTSLLTLYPAPPVKEME